jgi:hypothetical protein
MFNRITLVGTMADGPGEMYDTGGNKHAVFSLKVSPPADAPQPYWSGVYDLRCPEHDTFLVICRDPLLVGSVLEACYKDDVVCVEGRLVLTLLRCGGDNVPLVEVLASEVVLLLKRLDAQLQE